MEPVSVLAIVAHPDDAEMACGGLLLLEAKRGQRIGIIDLTQGEAGTRGSASIRKKEAEAAAKILGLSCREQLDLPDGFIEDSPTYRLKVIRMIRKYRPQVVVTNALKDRHPDHGAAAKLVTRAAFLAGLPKIETEDNGIAQNAHRPDALYYCIQGYYQKPHFIVDISSVWKQKMNALAAYSSQLYQPNQPEPQTHISTLAFQKFLHARARTLGFKIGVEYGEGFLSPRSIGIRSIDDLL